MGADGRRVAGRARGGKTAASKMSDAARRLRAQKGAAARWKKDLIATHKGNFQAELGLDVECYVLNDPGKTAVVSQTGMARALGLAARGSAFPKFVASQALAPFVGAELARKLQKPLVFHWSGGGAELPQTAVNGFDASLLIDVCNAIIAASAAGKLGKRYARVIQQASIVTGASAKSGIRGLVYALAGYNPTTDEVIQAFKFYVREEARKYEQEFPGELYYQWHRLYQIPEPERGKPWHFKHLTVRHIYEPLAKSHGKILELLRAEKAKGIDRRKKLFQFLSEVGTRALRMHLGRVLEMAESSATLPEYEAKVRERFGGQIEFDFGADAVQERE